MLHVRGPRDAAGPLCFSYHLQLGGWTVHPGHVVFAGRMELDSRGATSLESNARGAMLQRLHYPTPR